MRPSWQAVGISSLLVGRQQANTASPSSIGFTLFDKQLLDPSLGEQCIDAVTAQINCHVLVHGFTELKYRGSLGLQNLTDAVCTNDCQSSLRNWFNRVSSACPSTPSAKKSPSRLGGNMWAGWNETCVKDPKTKQYCNDIIANFTVVPNIESMPQSELCSTCFGRRLALMQSSPYSVYDAFYASQLAYIYAECGGSGPTGIPSLEGSSSSATPTPTSAPCSGSAYTTQQGDTCGSIASRNSVSAAALYMANQNLVRDCASVPAGISICLPTKCKTYTLQQNDNCTTIEIALGMDFGSVGALNTWVNADCSNLQPGTDWYGKTICVGPQGGVFTETNMSGVPERPTSMRNG